MIVFIELNICGDKFEWYNASQEDRYRIMALTKVETNIIASIAGSPVG